MSEKIRKETLDLINDTLKDSCATLVFCSAINEKGELGTSATVEGNPELIITSIVSAMERDIDFENLIKFAFRTFTLLKIQSLKNN